jgi:hypothetical protein
LERPARSSANASCGRRVVRGSWNEKVHIWDAVSGKDLRQFPGDRPWLSPDDKTLVTVTGLSDITVHV